MQGGGFIWLINALMDGCACSLGQGVYCVALRVTRCGMAGGIGPRRKARARHHYATVV